MSAEIFTPGLVKRNTTPQTTWFGIGELDGMATPRLREIEAIMRHVGHVELTGNIYSTKWTKLVANVSLNTVTALGRARVGPAFAEPRAVELMLALGREVVAVAQAAP